MDVIDRFSTTVFHDPDSAGYIAVSEEFPGLSGFGSTRGEALSELEVVLEMALETYRDEGWPVPTPKRPSEPTLPSGEFRVRVPKYLHALLSRRAEDEGVSQNTLVISFLAQGLSTSLASVRSDKAATTRASASAPATLRHEGRNVTMAPVGRAFGTVPPTTYVTVSLRAQKDDMLPTLAN